MAAASADGRSLAWLSLDQRDNDPVVFWTYVVAARLPSPITSTGVSPAPSQPAVPVA